MFQGSDDTPLGFAFGHRNVSDWSRGIAQQSLRDEFPLQRRLLHTAEACDGLLDFVSLGRIIQEVPTSVERDAQGQPPECCVLAEKGREIRVCIDETREVVEIRHELHHCVVAEALATRGRFILCNCRKILV